MAREFDAPSPQPGEQQEILPLEVLRPQIEVLIESFRVKLSQSPEFKDALVNNFLHGSHDSQGVEFLKGDYQYLVTLYQHPDIKDVFTEEEIERGLPLGIGSLAGSSELNIQRSPSREYREDLNYDEDVKLIVVTREGGRDKTEIRYNNFQQDIHVQSTQQALEKAREIIDNFSN